MIILRSEDGHTLTETLVAMVIILSILIPATASWIYFMRTQSNQQYSESIDLAVTQMEHVLNSKNYKEPYHAIESTPSGLILLTHVNHEERRIVIKVSVLSRTQKDTLYSLYTRRSVP